MLLTTKAIVLATLKYAENDLIITCYTQKKGRITCLQKGILKAKKAKVKSAYFQVFSQLELEVNYKENRNFQRIQEVKTTSLYHTLQTNVVKSSIALFLAEILHKIIQEEEANLPLYNFLESALITLDQESNIQNFHILFLLKLTQYLGFYPDTNQINLDYFNMLEGCFSNTTTNDKNTISGKNLNLLKTFLGITFDTLPTIKITATQRQEILALLLVYFKVHLGNFKTPKSLGVLQQVYQT